jgi:Protein of unknown function (DUF1266)
MRFIRGGSAAKRSTAEGIAIPHGALDVREVFPEPPSTRQRWILGLSAVMLDPEEGSCARLHPAAFVHPRKTPASYRTDLKAQWGIDGVGSLMSTLTRLLRSGHRGELAMELGHPPLAWDLARVAVLPRRAFAAGFIDEPTAWELMEAAVAPAYRCYGSWGAYVRDNVDGHNAWAGGSSDGLDRHVVRWWSPSLAAESPWQSVPWEAGRPCRPAAATGTVP